MKKVIQAILVIAMIVLAYFIYDSIQKPIRFEKEQKIRYDATIQRLIDIRTGEVAFKSTYGRYTGSFDSLVNFIKHGDFKIVKMIGTIPDSLVDQLQMTPKAAEALALKKGWISRDTVEVPVRDSLYKRPNFVADSLPYVPYTKGHRFELAAGNIMTGSKVMVNVFQAQVSNDTLLKGLDRQLIINFNEYREKVADYAGLRVGSLKEANNNAGNWE